MPTDTNVNSLVINKLTKAQYDDIQNPSETELYLVEESIDTTPTSESDNMVTSGGVYTALSGKANSADLATVATSGSYNDLSNKPSIPNDSNLVHKTGNETIFQTKTFAANGEIHLASGWHQIYNDDDDESLQEALDARNNVQADWNQTTTTAKDYIKNKPYYYYPETTTVPNVTSVGSASTWNFAMGTGSDEHTLIISGGNGSAPSLGTIKTVATGKLTSGGISQMLPLYTDGVINGGGSND